MILSIASLFASAGAGESLLPSIGLLLEPKFTDPARCLEIPGAQETVLVAARSTPSGAFPLSAKEWDAASLTWEEVRAAAWARAGRLQESMVIQWKRDARKVYHYAWIESNDPFLSSVIFSPGFANRFREFLGNEVLVVVPDRFTLFIFPRYGRTLEEQGPGLVRRYEEALFKVSLEVFLLTGDKEPRVIGKMGS